MVLAGFILAGCEEPPAGTGLEETSARFKTHKSVMAEIEHDSSINKELLDVAIKSARRSGMVDVASSRVQNKDEAFEYAKSLNMLPANKDDAEITVVSLVPKNQAVKGGSYLVVVENSTKRVLRSQAGR